jgi:hypothetical protein
MTVERLIERLKGVPGDSPVLLRVIDRRPGDGLRTTTFYYAEDMGGATEGSFMVTGYGRAELEYQAAAREGERSPLHPSTDGLAMASPLD